MDHSYLLYLILLPAILSTMGVTDSLTDNNQIIFDNSLRVGPVHKNKHSSMADANSKGSVSFSLPSSDGQSQLLLNNLDVILFHQRLPTQDSKLAVVPGRNMAAVSNIKNDASSQSSVVNVAQGSFIKHKDFKDSKPPEESIDRLVSSNNDNILLKSSYVNTVLGDNLRPDINGLRMKSSPGGCRIEGKTISLVDKAVKSHTESRPRTRSRPMKTRYTREVRQINMADTNNNNIWTNQKNSFLTNLGMESSSNALYENIENWPDQQTMGERKMDDLLQDAYSDDSLHAPPPELEYIQDIYSDVAMPFENVVSPSIPHLLSSDRRNVKDKEADASDDDNGIDKDDQKTDKIFIQPSSLGNYYYKDLDEPSGELLKRGTEHKNRLYAALMQNPRHSQRVALMDHPRGISSLRIQDKMERSQYKERPLNPLVSTSKGMVCEPENDGTMPMRCPSNADQCLYDVMICDGTQNCPQGEDETFALCVLRHWFFRWFRKLPPTT